MRLNKKIITAGLIGIMSLTMSVPAFALGWTKGISRNAWWYDLGNGNYHKSSWQWIDGNRDGIAECYCFDNEGWMYENTKTPDGYDVNADGAWVVNGVVQTKRVSKSNVPGGTSSSGYSSDSGSGSSSGTSRISSGSSRVSSGGSSSRGGSSSTNKTRISRTLVQEDDGKYYYVSRYSDGSVKKIEATGDAHNDMAREDGTYINDKIIEEYGIELINLVNEYRISKGLNELELDDELNNFSKIRAKELSVKFSHIRPNGELAIVAGQGEVATKSGNNPTFALKSFKSSKKHNNILIGEDYTKIGASCYVLNNNYYWVINFSD